MHNTIYQIITFPVTSDEYLSESDFRENSFVGDIANYVSGNTNRDEEIKYLRESFVKNQIAVFSDDNSFRILSDGKTNYCLYMGVKTLAFEAKPLGRPICTDKILFIWHLEQHNPLTNN